MTNSETTAQISRKQMFKLVEIARRSEWQYQQDNKSPQSDDMRQFLRVLYQRKGEKYFIFFDSTATAFVFVLN